MNFLSRGSGLVAVLIVVAAGVLATGFFNRSATPAEPRAARVSSGTAGVTPSSNRVTPPQLPPPPAADTAAEIAIDGAGKPSLTGDDLAARPTNLQAADRRAWRLTELIDGTYIHANTVIHAITIDGGDYILNEDGRQAADIIVVRRNTGELYVGWLDGGAGPERPLADAERPAERVERVARIALETRAREPADAPAVLAVVLDGKPHRTVTPDGFPALAQLAVRGHGDEASSVIDVSRALGGTAGAAKVVGLVAGGRRIAAAPPSPGARAVIYLTRRGRFKFAWVDAAGAPIDGTKQREVSELVLETAHVAARP